MKFICYMVPSAFLFCLFTGCMLDEVIDEIPALQKSGGTASTVFSVQEVQPSFPTEDSTCHEEVQIQAEVSQGLYQTYEKGVGDLVVTQGEADEMYETYLIAYGNFLEQRELHCGY